MFQALPDLPADAVLALAEACRNDPRRDKIDLSVGVYRNDNGVTPVLSAVKAAEHLLVEGQDTKSYVSPLGDTKFVSLIRELAIGNIEVDRLGGVQTPGGGGAVRLACEVIKLAAPFSRIFVGLPTWGNHIPIFEAVGLEIGTYTYYDVISQTLRFDEMLSSLKSARRGDIVLLHATCHNPSGTDLSLDQWRAIAQLVEERGLIPLIDFAYQGFGDGLEQDREGLEIVLSSVSEAFVAYSCSKNFGLYRERTGALFVYGTNPVSVGRTVQAMAALARVNWSMPPDHGAAVVGTILSNTALRQDWLRELTTMRERILKIRAAVGRGMPEFSQLGAQKGMFSTLPLHSATIDRLRKDDAIYIVGNGRINLAGLTTDDVPRFVDSVRRAV
ncbi:MULTISPECIES: amino acid aminotransferase [Bradyrhizobium]|uniref:Aromatic amino acid aminotransferase n=2 Tax=Bradyrhizobium TaxID=374 RepID=A0A410VI70_9BRAD|nr:MULTISPECIES: amino acid aminotransferase [Bradyrhizobium]MCG2643400.1 aspartate/tyrosine/aromatic aminotransferase [Bradyrhizobium zhengyangense]MDN4985980.1 amino acid aminotransferase [Bradyrhizobium sp. WYCCWR 13022]QAU43354.1 aromatic amino acid aminotransferase [Bradyrhizobium guangdongense]QAU50847.1 aromatic amino acid aminotransferase [Bradyrhizobium guangzhouense]QOZ56680.1 aromatic amino acid aminotransferase [Bradyrhizobium sp. CCBAU 53338]